MADVGPAVRGRRRRLGGRACAAWEGDGLNVPFDEEVRAAGAGRAGKGNVGPAARLPLSEVNRNTGTPERAQAGHASAVAKERPMAMPAAAEAAPASPAVRAVADAAALAAHLQAAVGVSGEVAAAGPAGRAAAAGPLPTVEAVMELIRAAGSCSPDVEDACGIVLPRLLAALRLTPASGPVPPLDDSRASSIEPAAPVGGCPSQEPPHPAECDAGVSLVSFTGLPAGDDYDNCAAGVSDDETDPPSDDDADDPSWAPSRGFRETVTPRAGDAQASARSFAAAGAQPGGGGSSGCALASSAECLSPPLDDKASVSSSCDVVADSEGLEDEDEDDLVTAGESPAPPSARQRWQPWASFRFASEVRGTASRRSSIAASVYHSPADKLVSEAADEQTAGDGTLLEEEAESEEISSLKGEAAEDEDQDLGGIEQALSAEAFASAGSSSPGVATEDGDPGAQSAVAQGQEGLGAGSSGAEPSWALYESRRSPGRSPSVSAKETDSPLWSQEVSVATASSGRSSMFQTSRLSGSAVAAVMAASLAAAASTAVGQFPGVNSRPQRTSQGARGRRSSFASAIADSDGGRLSPTEPSPTSRGQPAPWLPSVHPSGCESGSVDVAFGTSTADGSDEDEFMEALPSAAFSDGIDIDESGTPVSSPVFVVRDGVSSGVGGAAPQGVRALDGTPLPAIMSQAVGCARGLSPLSVDDNVGADAVGDDDNDQVAVAAAAEGADTSAPVVAPRNAAAAPLAAPPSLLQVSPPTTAELDEVFSPAAGPRRRQGSLPSLRTRCSDGLDASAAEPLRFVRGVGAAGHAFRKVIVISDSDDGEEDGDVEECILEEPVENRNCPPLVLARGGGGVADRFHGRPFHAPLPVAGAATTGAGASSTALRGDFPDESQTVYAISRDGRRRTTQTFTIDCGALAVVEAGDDANSQAAGAHGEEREAGAGPAAGREAASLVHEVESLDLTGAEGLPRSRRLTATVWGEEAREPDGIATETDVDAEPETEVETEADETEAGAGAAVRAGGRGRRPPFRAQRQALAEQLYREYNARVFAERLPERLEIRWSPHLNTTAGVTHYSRTTISAELAAGSVTAHDDATVYTASIELATKVVDEEQKLRKTLAHEMCHVAAWVVDHVAKPPHGAAFRRWAARFAACYPALRISTRHSYVITYRYWYQCTRAACSNTFGRHSKSVDFERHRCGACGGRLELQPRRKADGTPHKPRGPSEFSRFVKDNFAAEKRAATPGTPHAEVMRSLSRRWREEKARQAVQPSPP